MTLPPEAWLRGPIDGILAELQPAAHALRQVREGVEPLVVDLTPAQLWARPGGTASIGFHLAHLPGSVDRLLTYSRGSGLSEDQLAILADEQTIHEDRPGLPVLMARFITGMDGALDYLRSVRAENLLTPREVGRKRLPSNTLGLIFHAAEHSSRHAGQIVTLARIVRAPAPHAPLT